ncbi:hypothetical protein PGSY75_0409000 [Plasmodium gaboni]|uniref:Oocyst capsule protein n=1 Tax=Plasmodium gaboni TaxID=647221 RepID=A0A151LUG3_9APIC|nr:hypothetical protein PGSY75_0409000 [Plasmodium gaboni]KYO02798.1 hypothetical protein PGSY75_0409000 [Plasmodium gaboni]
MLIIYIYFLVCSIIIRDVKTRISYDEIISFNNLNEKNVLTYYSYDDNSDKCYMWYYFKEDFFEIYYLKDEYNIIKKKQRDLIDEEDVSRTEMCNNNNNNNNNNIIDYKYNTFLENPNNINSWIISDNICCKEILIFIDKKKVNCNKSLSSFIIRVNNNNNKKKKKKEEEEEDEGEKSYISVEYNVNSHIYMINNIIITYGNKTEKRPLYILTDNNKKINYSKNDIFDIYYNTEYVDYIKILFNKVGGYHELHIKTKDKKIGKTKIFIILRNKCKHIFITILLYIYEHLFLLPNNTYVIPGNNIKLVLRKKNYNQEYYEKKEKINNCLYIFVKNKNIFKTYNIQPLKMKTNIYKSNYLNNDSKNKYNDVSLYYDDYPKKNSHLYNDEVKRSEYEPEKLSFYHYYKYIEFIKYKQYKEHIKLMQCLKEYHITNFENKYKIMPSDEYDIIQNDVIQIKNIYNNNNNNNDDDDNKIKIHVIIKNEQNNQTFSSFLYLYHVHHINIDCFYPNYIISQHMIEYDINKKNKNTQTQNKKKLYEQDPLIYIEMLYLKYHFFYKHYYYFNNYYIHRYFKIYRNNTTNQEGEQKKGIHEDKINLLANTKYLCFIKLVSDNIKENIYYNNLINSYDNKISNWIITPIKKNNFNMFIMYTFEEQLAKLFLTCNYIKKSNFLQISYNQYEPVKKYITYSSKIKCYIKEDILMSTLYIVPDEKIYYICYGGIKNSYIIKIFNKYDFIHVHVNDKMISIQLKKNNKHEKQNIKERHKKKDYSNDKKKYLNYSHNKKYNDLLYLIVIQFCDQYNINNCFISKIYIIQNIHHYYIILEKNTIEINHTTKAYVYMYYDISKAYKETKYSLFKYAHNNNKKNKGLNIIHNNHKKRNDKIDETRKKKKKKKNYYDDNNKYDMYNNIYNKNDINHINSSHLIPLTFCFYKIHNNIIINFDKTYTDITTNVIKYSKETDEKYKNSCGYFYIKGKKKGKTKIEIKYIKDKYIEYNSFILNLDIYNKINALFCVDFVCSKYIKHNQLIHLIIYDGFNKKIPYEINISSEDDNNKYIIIKENKILNKLFNIKGNLLFHNLFLDEQFSSIFQSQFYKHIYNPKKHNYKNVCCDMKYIKKKNNDYSEDNNDSDDDTYLYEQFIIFSDKDTNFYPIKLYNRKLFEYDFIFNYAFKEKSKKKIIININKNINQNDNQNINQNDNQSDNRDNNMNYLCSCSKYSNVLLRQRNYYKNKKQKKENISNDMYNNTYSDIISYYDNFVYVQKYYFIYGMYEKKNDITSNIIIQMKEKQNKNINSTNFFPVHIKYPSSIQMVIFDKHLKKLYSIQDITFDNNNNNNIQDIQDIQDIYYHQTCNPCNFNILSLYNNHNYFFKTFLIDDKENVILTNENFKYTLKPYLINLHPLCYKNKSHYLENEQNIKKIIINTNKRILLNHTFKKNYKNLYKYNNTNNQHVNINNYYPSFLFSFSFLSLTVEYKYIKEKETYIYEKELFITFYDQIYINTQTHLYLFYSSLVYYKIYICNIHKDFILDYDFKGKYNNQINIIFNNENINDNSFIQNILSHMKKYKESYIIKEIDMVTKTDISTNNNCSSLYINSTHINQGILYIYNNNKFFFEIKPSNINISFNEISKIKISLSSSFYNMKDSIILRLEFFNKYNQKFSHQMPLQLFKIKLLYNYKKINLNLIQNGYKNSNYNMIKNIKSLFIKKNKENKENRENKEKIKDEEEDMIFSDLFYYVDCQIVGTYYIQIELTYNNQENNNKTYKYKSIISNMAYLLVYSPGKLLHDYYEEKQLAEIEKKKKKKKKKDKNIKQKHIQKYNDDNNSNIIKNVIGNFINNIIQNFINDKTEEPNKLIMNEQNNNHNIAHILLHPLNQSIQLHFKFDHPYIYKILCVSKNYSVVVPTILYENNNKNKEKQYRCLIKTNNIVGNTEIHIYPIFIDYFNIFLLQIKNYKKEKQFVSLQKYDLHFHDIETYYINFCKYKSNHPICIQSEELRIMRRLYFLQVHINLDYITSVRFINEQSENTLYVPLKKRFYTFLIFLNKTEDIFQHIDFKAMYEKNSNEKFFILEYFADTDSIVLNDKRECVTLNIRTCFSQHQKNEEKNNGIFEKGHSIIQSNNDNIDKHTSTNKKYNKILKVLKNSSDTFLSIKAYKEGNYVLYVKLFRDNNNNNNIIVSKKYNIVVTNNIHEEKKYRPTIQLSTSSIYNVYKPFHLFKMFQIYNLSHIEKIKTPQYYECTYFSSHYYINKNNISHKKGIIKIKINISHIYSATIKNYYTKYIPLNVIQYFYIHLYNKNMQNISFPSNGKLILNISHPNILDTIIMNNSHIYIIPNKIGCSFINIHFVLYTNYKEYVKTDQQNRKIIYIDNLHLCVVNSMKLKHFQKKNHNLYYPKKTYQLLKGYNHEFSMQPYICLKNVIKKTNKQNFLPYILNKTNFSHMYKYYEKTRFIKNINDYLLQPVHKHYSIINDHCTFIKT